MKNNLYISNIKSSKIFTSGLIMLISLWNIEKAECMTTNSIKVAKEVGKQMESRIPSTTTSNNIPINITQQTRDVSYTVRKTHATTTTHEHAQNNPLLGKSTDKAYQHPTYTQNSCDQDQCENKVCANPCGPIVESKDVGHATHGSTMPTAEFVSNIDLDGNNKVQRGVFYEKPTKNTDTVGETIDQGKTDQLNKDDKHLYNVHMHAKISSKKQKDIDSIEKTDNNDENIN